MPGTRHSWRSWRLGGECRLSTSADGYRSAHAAGMKREAGRTRKFTAKTPRPPRRVSAGRGLQNTSHHAWAVSAVNSAFQPNGRRPPVPPYARSSRFHLAPFPPERTCNRLTWAVTFSLSRKKTLSCPGAQFGKSDVRSEKPGFRGRGGGAVAHGVSLLPAGSPARCIMSACAC